MTSVKSRYAFSETVARLSQSITGAGNTLFATIDQAAAAQQVGLALRPTTLLLFGNPKAGTGLMKDVPLLALDLPLKLLIWEDDDCVSVAYTPMSEIALRYGMTGHEALIGAMDGALAHLAGSVS